MEISDKKVLTIEEIKKIQLDILKYVHRLCIDNDIKYSLCGGTLIGAIRHGGYIPWDDDVDILLTRSNFQKLIDLLKEKAEYKILTMETQADYYYGHAKLVDNRTKLIEHDLPSIKNLGVNIDIFVVDGFPNDDELRKKHIKLINKFSSRIYNTLGFNLFRKGVSWKKNIRQIIKIPYVMYCKIFGLSYWKRKLSNSLIKYSIKDCKYAGNLLSVYGEKEIMRKEVFEETISIEFESHKFLAMKNYDEFLKNIYGNYMQLPPKNKRVPHHNFTAYWSDK